MATGPKGARRALAWLEEQGNRGSRALGQTMMALEKSLLKEEEVVAFLESPTEMSVKTHLALAWAPTSFAAQDFLRSEWPGMSAMGLDLAFSQLGKVKNPQDAPLLFEVIRNETVESSARASAVVALGENPKGPFSQASGLFYPRLRAAIEHAYILYQARKAHASGLLYPRLRD